MDDSFRSHVIFSTVIQTILFGLPLIGYFYLNLTHEQYLYYWSFFKTMSFFLIAVVSVKLYLWMMDSLNGAGTLEKCKRDYQICFGLISLITVITHIVVFIAGEDANMILFATFFSFGSSSILLLAFGIPATSETYLIWFDYFPIYNFLIHIVLFIFKIATTVCGCLSSPSLFLVVFFSQGLVTFLPCPMIAYFYDLMNGEVYLNWDHPEWLDIEEEDEYNETDESDYESSDDSENENDESQVESEEESDNEDGEMRYKESECKVCFNKYHGKSEKRTPRILTSCGHTVCHKCLISLLRRAKWFVTCPFCKKETYVSEGSAENLPKNHAIIGLIEEIKGERNKNVME